VVLKQPAGLKALELYVDNIKNGAQQGALSGYPRRHLSPHVRRQGLQHGHLLVDAAAARQ